MRFKPVSFLVALALAACGARTGLSEPVADTPLDAGVDSSAKDATQDTLSEVKDSTTAEIAMESAPDHQPSGCALLPIQDFLQLGTGEKSSSHFPAARWIGDAFALAWLEGNEEGGSPSTYYALVKNGKIEVPQKEVIPDNHYGPAPVWNGQELVFCWNVGQNTMIARLDRNGDRVVPDKTMIAGHGYGCSLRKVGDRLLASLFEGNSTSLAWTTLQGDLLEGPTNVIDGADASTTMMSLAPLEDGGFMVAWATEPQGKIDLKVQRFDTHFVPVGEQQHPASTLSRPFRPVLRRVGAGLALVVSSDTDQAPSDGWSVWMQSLTLEGKAASAPVRVGETQEWERPATLDVGETVLLGTIKVGQQKDQDPVLATYTPEGLLQGKVSWNYPLPEGPNGELSLATGPYWGEVGVAFSGYAGQARQEIFFTTLACGE